MKRDWLPFLLVAGAAFLIGFCNRAPDNAKLELDRERLNQRVASMRSDSIARESVAVIRRARIASLTKDNALLRVERETLDKGLRKITQRVEQYDSLVPRVLVDSLIEGHNVASRALVSENDNLREQVDLWRALYLSRDSAATAFHDAMHEALRQRDAYRKAARPGLLTQVRRGLPWLLAGAVVWELAR